MQLSAYTQICVNGLDYAPRQLVILDKIISEIRVLIRKVNLSVPAKNGSGSGSWAWIFAFSEESTFK